jgi:hypothetical protein
MFDRTLRNSHTGQSHPRRSLTIAANRNRGSITLWWEGVQNPYRDMLAMPLAPALVHRRGRFISLADNRLVLLPTTLPARA